MARHDGLVHAVIHRQYGGSLSYLELLQAGRIGLWRALCSFDPHRGTTFSTYAWPAIAHQIWQEVTAAEPSRQEYTTAHPPYLPPMLMTSLSAPRSVTVYTNLSTLSLPIYNRSFCFTTVFGAIPHTPYAN